METGSELDKPLGQNRKKRAPTGRFLSPGRWIILASCVILAAAGFIALQNDALRQHIIPTKNPVLAQIEPAAPTAAPASSTDDDQGSASSRNKSLSGNSGADISTTLTREGEIVTTVSPRERDTDGPLVLSGVGSVGQDARMAHLPVPELLENSDFGRLPIRGEDGTRALDAYARPWSGARGTRIAIVVGGLGLSQTGTQYAIDTLPEEITLAFAASGNSLQRWLQEARRNGHEIILQVPFEPFDYPRNDPGPHTLIIEDGTKQNLSDLHWAMARITNYTGIMNFMGGRFLANADATEPVMRDLAKRGLLFLDDGTSAQNLTQPLASAVGVPFAAADIVVDSQVNRGEIMKKLDEAERIARRNGSAIATASAFATSVDAVAAWANEAKARGIEIVAISALVEDPEKF